MSNLLKTSIVGLLAVGCSILGIDAGPLDIAGSYVGTGQIVDRGNTYRNLSFEASLEQLEDSLYGTAKLSANNFAVSGVVQNTGTPASIKIALELLWTGPGVSDSIPCVTGFVFTGNASARITTDGGVVADQFSGSFTGPDCFGGTSQATFSSSRQ